MKKKLSKPIKIDHLNMYALASVEKSRFAAKKAYRSNQTMKVLQEIFKGGK